jgi:hypothetical protein
MPLASEPNLPGQEQQPGNLDPEVERLIRAYAEAEAEGDPKKEKRLVKQYMKDSSLIEVFKDFNRRGPTTLASSGRDLSKLMKKQEKEE